MSSSAFSPTLTVTGGTSQQGEINIITNPIAQSNTSDWTTSNASLSRVATGSPLDPEIPTGFQAVSTTTTTSYVQTALQNVAPSLRNRKLKVQFFLALTDSTSWKVDVFKSDGVTRYPLSTDSSAVTVIPALTGTFTTTFDMDSDSGIYVRFTRHAGAGTSTLNFTNLIVGPGIQPQGAVVQEWQSYTPTYEGLGTVTNNSARYRRVGDSIQVIFSVTSGTNTATLATVSLPSGLTINSTGIPNNSIVGDLSASATPFDSSILYFSGASTKVYFTSGTANYTAGANGTTWANSTGFGGNFTLPIAEWSGSGTVQLAQNDVEYVWNSDPGVAAGTTYSNSVYYGYGPSGTPIVSVNSSTTTGESKTFYTVQFQTPVQNGDQVIFELNDGNGWFTAAQRLPNITSNAASYGTGIIAVNNTTYRVAFGNAGYGPAGATTYGSAGGAWSTVASTWRWRVRKTSAGAAVGFGIVQSGSAGLVPASNSNFDDSTATRLGLKQYLHGTTYNGGNAPTVTCAQAGFAVVRAVFVPYQTQDGAWRMRFNIASSITSTSSAISATISTNAVVYKNISNFFQAVVVSVNGSTPAPVTQSVCNPNTAGIVIAINAGTTIGGIHCSGDVELESKPTWAY